jgi:hypothetical protein
MDELNRAGSAEEMVVELALTDMVEPNGQVEEVEKDLFASCMRHTDTAVIASGLSHKSFWPHFVQRSAEIGAWVSSREQYRMLSDSSRCPQRTITTAMSVQCPPFAPFFGFAGVASAVSKVFVMSNVV